MKNKDIFRELGAVDEKYILEADPTAASHQRKGRGMLSSVLIAACLSLFLISLLAIAAYIEFGLDPYGDPSGTIIYWGERTNDNTGEDTRKPDGEIVKDHVGLINAIKNHSNSGRSDYSNEASVESSANVGKKQNSYIEVTDNQVEGVIEADLFKRTATHIFYLDEKEDVLRVYNIGGERSALVSQYVFNYDFISEMDHLDLHEMYLSDDGKTLTVIAVMYDPEEYYGGNSYQQKTVVISLDVSDPKNIKEKKSIFFSGYCTDSRAVDGKIYIVTSFLIHFYKLDFTDESKYIPQIDTGNGFESISTEDIIIPGNGPANHYTVVMCIDEKELDLVNVKAILRSDINEVFVTKDKILLVDNYTKYVERKENNENYVDWNRFADFYVFSIKDGKVEYLNSFTVTGSVEGQYSIDEYKGVIRIAATTNLCTWSGDVWLEKGKLQVGVSFDAERDLIRYGTNASLYFIDTEFWSLIVEVKDFAPWGESVASVRFEGDIAYVCTAEIAITIKDPVYFFDLSDINNITYTDTGTIEGYSSSLVDFKDGVLIGIGCGDSHDTFKLEAYKEVGSKVESVCSYTRNDVEYSDDYKAYYIDRESGLIGLMLRQKKTGNYILFRFDGKSFTEVLTVEQEGGSPRLARATVIDGYFYYFSCDQFIVIKIF